VEGSDHGLF